MTTQEIIEYYQDPLNARQYLWLKTCLSDHAKVIEAAYVAGYCRYLRPNGTWESPIVNPGSRMCNNDCYIIAPGYKPEPEYVKCRIEKMRGGGSLCARNVPHKYGVPEDHAIYIVCTFVNFVGFCDKNGNRLALDEVATAYRDGREPEAWFLKV